MAVMINTCCLFTINNDACADWSVWGHESRHNLNNLGHFVGLSGADAGDGPV